MNQAYSFDLLDSGVLLIEETGRIQYANLSAQELLGLSARQLDQAALTDLLDCDTELRQRLLEAFAGHYGVLRQTLVLRPAAASRAIDATVVPLEGQPWAALVELRRAPQPEYFGRTQALNKELDAQRESLRNLAHEIKNPLGGIRGAAQLLEAELYDDRLYEYTGVIMDEVDRLRALIDLLVGPQSQSLQLSPLNIHEVCERVYTLVQAEFAHQIKVTRDYDASVPELQGDMARLVQALLNIARNGAQALVEAQDVQQPTLTLRTRVGRHLVLGDRSVRMGVVVSVIDNGPGVSDSLRDRIFLPLLTGRAQGTGLGLSMAQELVHQHGGALEYDSRPGCTEFRLILPLEA